MWGKPALCASPDFSAGNQILKKERNIKITKINKHCRNLKMIQQINILFSLL
jgi:hypothetical protein